MTDNDQQMADDIASQIMDYLMAFTLSQNKPQDKWRLYFTTDEDILKPLVELLNHPKKKRVILGHEIFAVQPYEDDTI